MAGYIRQASGNMVSGLVIRAADHNAEFDALRDAFHATTGHQHDGTTGDAPLIDLTTSVTGDLPVAEGGTGSSTAGGARTNLGLVIGTDVQAFDATLLSLAALGTAADKFAYTTALDTWAESSITALGRTLLADATTGAMQSSLGLVIGTNVQAQDATLTSIALLGTAADKLLYTTGVDTWAEAAITAAGLALLDDAAASNQRTTLGLGSMATQAASAVAITGGTASGISSLALTGATTTTSTFDGRDVATDGTKLDTIETSATADQSDAEIETAYNNQVGAMSQATAEAGTSTTVERVTAQRISQAIAALGTGATALSGLSDVTSAAVTDKFALMADGAAYVGRAIVEADISDLQTYAVSGGAFHDGFSDYAANEHFTQANITVVGTVVTGNVDAVVSAASLTVAGKVELATGAETNTGTDATRAVTPDGLDDWTGSAQVVTVGTLASGDADAIVSTSAEGTAGILELATSAETETATNDTKAVTPLKLDEQLEGFRPQNEQTGATYTAVAGDAGAVIVMNRGTAQTLNINDSVFEADDMITVVQKGAGAVTIAGSASNDVHASDTLVMDGQYSWAFIFIETGGASTVSYVSGKLVAT